MKKENLYDDAELEALKQLNIRVSETDLLAYEAVKKSMYVRDKALPIKRAIEKVLNEATAFGKVWLSQNHSKPLNAKRVKELAGKEARCSERLNKSSTSD